MHGLRREVKTLTDRRPCVRRRGDVDVDGLSSAHDDLGLVGIYCIFSEHQQELPTLIIKHCT